VTVVWAPAPRTVHEVTLEVPDGASASQALAETGWALGTPDDLGLSVWGRRVRGDDVLREGDRLEVTRPLRVDPKDARRERFRRQGTRTAGLFARSPRR